MKKENNLIYKIYSIAFATIFILQIIAVSDTYGVSKVNQTSICVQCHSDVAKFNTFKNVHKPVKDGKCSSCHNMHASSHDNLLKDDISDLCYSCHSGLKNKKYKSKHLPFSQGKCLDCHDPHGSNYRNMLSKSSDNRCLDCHESKSILVGKNKHPEVKRKRCLSCHSAHGSNKSPLLRASSVAGLCQRCHSGEKAPKGKSHAVKNANCISCHSAHGSDKKSLIYDFSHEPFAKGECSACHKNENYKIVSKDAGLCLKCHEDVLETFNNASSHLVSSGPKGACLSCHSPHGGDKKFLMNRYSGDKCFNCHQDTKVKVSNSNFVHTGINDCLSCHSGHSSPNRRFLKIEEGNERLCDKCHSEQGTFTHPVGEGIIDPRTNQPVQCFTCHNVMGSPEKFILVADPFKVLCEQCHQM